MRLVIWIAIALIMTSLQWIIRVRARIATLLWFPLIYCSTLYHHQVFAYGYICLLYIYVPSTHRAVHPDYSLGVPNSQRHAIILTNTILLLIRHLGTYLCGICIKIQELSKKNLKLLSETWRTFCFGLTEFFGLIIRGLVEYILLQTAFFRYIFYKGKSSWFWLKFNFTIS